VRTTATELARRIRERDVSPVEVMEETLRGIEARNPRLNAFAHQAFDEAMVAAREAETCEPVGPLYGVPTALKDLFDFKPGWPATMGGIRALADYRPPFACGWCERMERAGAIIVGKTNSPTMGLRGTTDNYLFGPTRNPWDTSRNAGGSSGGAAAAIADGMLTIAEGTDGGGSIRIPAAWCGVYGYKPSWGRAPAIIRPNAFGGTSPFLFEGVITRTVADAALGMAAFAGYDPRDPFGLHDEVDFLGALDRGVAGLRIGYSADLDVFPVDRRIGSVVADAVRAFEDAGAHVEPVTLGITHDQRELSDVWSRLIMPANIAVIEDLKAEGYDVRPDLPPEFLHWLDLGYEMTVLDTLRDQTVRTEVFDAMQSVFAGHDLLVCPTVAALPVPNADDGNTVGPSEVEGVAVDPLIGWCLTYFANFTGHPAASIPAGMADGLPVGMQIIGRRGADADVMAASAAFERLRPWGFPAE
jgi:amidase/aspartyl-tRNA(Asn)/glutamyl-tRNA(Gln) amidotransferase subunit A